MSKTPSSIFDGGDLDVSGFAPKSRQSLNEMSPDLVRASLRGRAVPEP